MDRYGYTLLPAITTVLLLPHGCACPVYEIIHMSGEGITCPRTGNHCPFPAIKTDFGVSSTLLTKDTKNLAKFSFSVHLLLVVIFFKSLNLT